MQLYFTEAVELERSNLESIRLRGNRSTPGGRPHNPFCSKCNLYPMPEPPQRRPVSPLPTHALDVRADRDTDKDARIYDMLRDKNPNYFADNRQYAIAHGR